MSGHTPAPWEMEYDGEAHIIRMGTAIGSRQSHEVQHAITYDHGLWPEEEGSSQFAEAEANARLIIASPDLLQAIKPYMRFLAGKAGTGWCMHDRDVYELSAQEAYSRLEAAVAKAEGHES